MKEDLQAVYFAKYTQLVWVKVGGKWYCVRDYLGNKSKRLIKDKVLIALLEMNKESL